MPGALLGRRACRAGSLMYPVYGPATINQRLGAFSGPTLHPGVETSKTLVNFGVYREPRPSKRPNRRVRPPNRIARPLSNAPVLNRWFRYSRRLSLLAMRPQQAHAASGVGPAHELPQQRRTGHIKWIHILLAAAGLTFASAVAGVLVYNWYFDSVLAGLSSSLQPLSDAFHQLGASHITHASPAPGN